MIRCRIYLQRYNDTSAMPPFVFQRTDKNLVKREINTLKSPGHDKILVKVLKDAVEILPKPLAIFQVFHGRGDLPGYGNQ